MPPRTLVIGTPLPHVSFDNYSFASAPSIPEYTRLIVEMSAVSRVVDEVTNGSAEHKTLAGEPVVNGDTTASNFGLADLLAMRAREAAQFFARGGVFLCVAYPDAVHYGIQGVDAWRRYEWLPRPDGFDYKSGLLPGFGKAPVEVSDPGHPFADYIALYGKRMAYRAHIAEEAGSETRVFGRSSGGVAVAFDMALASGRIVLVPPLLVPEKDRTEIADTLFACFERLDAEQATDSPENFRKEAK